MDHHQSESSSLPPLLSSPYKSFFIQPDLIFPHLHHYHSSTPIHISLSPSYLSPALLHNFHHYHHPLLPICLLSLNPLSVLITSLTNALAFQFARFRPLFFHTYTCLFFPSFFLVWEPKGSES